MIKAGRELPAFCHCEELEATWQSVTFNIPDFNYTPSITEHFGERIAAPVCALVRNDIVNEA